MRDENNIINLLQAISRDQYEKPRKRGVTPAALRGVGGSRNRLTKPSRVPTDDARFYTGSYAYSLRHRHHAFHTQVKGKSVSLILSMLSRDGQSKATLDFPARDNAVPERPIAMPPDIEGKLS